MVSLVVNMEGRGLVIAMLNLMGQPLIIVRVVNGVNMFMSKLFMKMRLDHVQVLVRVLIHFVSTSNIDMG